MPQTATHPLVDAYRKRLLAASRRLPRRERRDLLDAVDEHLTAGTREATNEADILNMLDDLGDPQEIVEATQPVAAPRRLGFIEIAAVVLLLVGAFVVPVVGWVVGVALLWASPAWPARKKWLGTFVVPGGLAAPLAMAWYGPSRTDCSARSLPPPTGAFPPPPGGDRSEAVVDASVRMCSTEPLIAGWLGVVVALVLVAATVAVAIHLLCTAQVPRDDFT
jgi:hypothetical protein